MTIAVDCSLVHDVLAAAETIRQYEPAEVLFRESEPTLGVYIVHSGEVELLAGAEEKGLKAIRRATAGEILSLSQAVSGRVHDATAVVTAASRIGFVANDAFLAALNANAAWPPVLQLLSEQIHSMYDAIKAGSRA